jgi:TrmH family RNA methyltransferase
VPTLLGAHNARIESARDLLSKKGRRERRAFSFEGPTLLAEALQSQVAIQAIYVTKAMYEATPLAREIESRGVDVFIVDDRAMRKISDVETPSGIVAVAPIVLETADELLNAPGLVLVLADLNDPGNAGTLLRSAEAFGVNRIVFGSRGVEPHNPKVVRGAMGAIFRHRIAVVTPADLHAVLGDWEVTGLAMAGEPLDQLHWGRRCALVVGHERRGVGAWQPLCTRLGTIRMRGQAESLNAAVAGSIALYEASKRLHP